MKGYTCASNQDYWGHFDTATWGFFKYPTVAMPCCHTSSQSGQDWKCANHPVASWGKFDVGEVGMERTGLRTLSGTGKDQRVILFTIYSRGKTLTWRVGLVWNLKVTIWKCVAWGWYKCGYKSSRWDSTINDHIQGGIVSMLVCVSPQAWHSWLWNLNVPDYDMHVWKVINSEV